MQMAWFVVTQTPVGSRGGGREGGRKGRDGRWVSGWFIKKKGERECGCEKGL